MKTEEKRIRVAVNFGDKGTVYGCGHTLDTLLYSQSITTEMETREWTDERTREAIDWELKEYDFDTYTLERLNDAKASDMLGEILARKLPVGLITASEIDASEYLPGDWLRFNKPDAFESIVSADEAYITEAVEDRLGSWDDAPIPSDLAKRLKRACDSAEEDVLHEWLHGDRSTPGVLAGLASAMFGRYTGASVEWVACTDTVTIEATEDAWREWLGYDLDERDPLPTPEELAEEVKKRAVSKAEDIRTERKLKSEKRVAEYRRREQTNEEELKRKQEEARERKRKRNQA